jgi:primosomal protein N' (replication factor Y)
MSSVARVALDSPLPNLDRLFDYSVPEDLRDTLRVGQRVRVGFGRSKKLQDAFVVELAENSEFSGKLADITEVVSTVCVLPQNLYKLCRALADRQASTLGDVISGAVVSRSVAVEKKFVAANPTLAQRPTEERNPKLEALLAQPTLVSSKFATQPIPGWIDSLLLAAQATLENGESAIIIAPDFRDLAQLREVIASSSLAANFIDYAADQTGSKRYGAFLNCMTEAAHLVVGSRSAAFAPLQNLGLVAIFDDGDLNLQEQQSPYAHARDIALLRQTVELCDLLFVSHSRSCEVQRLIDLNYLVERENRFASPNISFDESISRVSTLAWQTIREATASGAVLVQVAAKGTARSAYCQQCSTRALCKNCNGPIWIDAQGMPRCRWCNAQNLDYRCGDCGTQRLRQGFGGSTRTVSEFGKAFAGVQVLESTGDNPVLEISSGKKIVIATPGAEPNVAGGYEAVIILDAQTALSKDSLRASEDAVRSWSNAIAKMKPGGRAVLAGAPQQLGQRFALWQQREIARDELDNRRELEFPPHLRLASIEGPLEVITNISSDIKLPNVQVLGPIQVRGNQGEQNMRFVLKYAYSAGADLSEAIRAAQLKLTSGLTKTSSTGRISRAVRVRMDDPEVI